MQISVIEGSSMRCGISDCRGDHVNQEIHLSRSPVKGLFPCFFQKLFCVFF